MSNLAPYFVDPDQRLNALGPQTRAELSKAMEGSSDPEAVADKWFVSAFLSERMKKPHQEVLRDYDALKGNFFKKEVSDSEAYASLVDYFKSNNVPRGTQNDFIDAGKTVMGGTVKTGLMVAEGSLAQTAVLGSAAMGGHYSEPEKKSIAEIKDRMKEIAGPGNMFITAVAEPERQILDWNFLTAAEQAEFRELNAQLAEHHENLRKRIAVKATDSLFMDWSKDVGAKRKAFVEWNKIDKEFSESVVGGVLDAVGQMGVYIPAAFVPYVGPMAIESALYQEAVDDYRENGGTDQLEEFRVGMQYAIPGMILERMGIESVIGKIWKHVPKKGKISGAEIAKGAAKAFATAGAAEGSTEALQGLLLDSIASLSYDEGRELFTEEAFKKRVLEFTVGAIAGGGISSVFSATGSVLENRRKDNLIRSKTGEPLTQSEFLQAREYMTDKQARERLGDAADTFIQAMNGSRIAQLAYNAMLSPNLEGTGFKKLDSMEGVDLYQSGNSVFALHKGPEEVRVFEIDTTTEQGKQFMADWQKRSKTLELRELTGIDVVEEFEAERLQSQVSGMETVPTLVKRGDDWVMLDPDEEVVQTFKTEAEGLEYLTQYVVEAPKRAGVAMTNEAIGYFEQFMDGNSTFVHMSEVNPTLADLVRKGSVRQSAALRAIRAIKPLDGNERPTLEDMQEISIFGRNQAIRDPKTNRMVQDISYIYQNGNPLTVIEERSEGYIKWALDSGELTEAELMDWKHQWEDFLGENKYADTREGALELFSDLVVDYVLTDGGTVRDVGDSKILREILPTWFETFVRKLQVYFRAVLNHAMNLVYMKELGQLDANLETHILRALGRDEDYNLERERNEAAGAGFIPDPATELSNILKGKIPHPQILRTKGDPMASDVAELYENLVKTVSYRIRARRGDKSSPVVKTARRRNTAAADRFFPKDVKVTDLDHIRESLNEQGFQFETIDEMLSALNDSMHGLEQYPLGDTFQMVPISGDYLTDPSFTPEQRMTIFRERLKWLEKYGRQDDPTGFSPSFMIDSEKLGGDFAKAGNVDELKSKLKRVFGEEGVDELFSEHDSGLIEDTFHSAWHGSPYNFDKFSNDWIGKGEGNQAFGWGLYFADKEGVAKHYRDKLSKQNNPGVLLKADGNPYIPVGGSLTEYQAFELLQSHADTWKDVSQWSQSEFDKAREGALEGLQWAIEFHGNLKEASLTYGLEPHDLNLYLVQEFPEVRAQSFADLPDGEIRDQILRDLRDREIRQFTEQMIVLEGFKFVPGETRSGKIYKVNLAPEQDEYLLWDEMLDEQSPKVQAALEKLDENTGYWAEIENRASAAGVNPTGQNLYTLISQETGQRDASELLHSYGIRGIKYKNYARGTEKEAFNYVIFDASDITIEDTFSLGDKQKTLGRLREMTPAQVYKYLKASKSFPGLAEESGTQGEFDFSGKPIPESENKSLAIDSAFNELLSQEAFSGRLLEDILTTEGQAMVSQSLNLRGRVSSIAPALVKGDIPNLKWEGQKVLNHKDFAYLAATLRNPYQELFGAAVLNEDGEIIRAQILTAGTISSSLVDVKLIRKLVNQAGDNARKVIIWHNHPSGNPNPSAADMMIHKMMEGTTFGKNVSYGGQLITNGDRYYSMGSFFQSDYGLLRKFEEIPKMPPWELVPRRNLPFVSDPETLNSIATGLRTHAEDKDFIIYLTTKNALTAIEQHPRNLTYRELLDMIVRGASDFGSPSILLATTNQRPIQDFRQLQKDLEVYQIDLLDVTSSGWLSMKRSGLINESFSMMDSQKLPDPPPDDYGITPANELFNEYHSRLMRERAETQREEEEKALAEGRIPLTKERGFISYAGLPLSSRIRRISPGVFSRLRKFGLDVNVQIQDSIARTMPLRIAYSALSKEKRKQVGLALINGDFDFVRSVLNGEELQEAIDVMAGLRKAAIKAGYEVGEIDNYWPRHIKDLDGLLGSFGRERDGIIRNAIRNAESKNGLLTEEEKITVINQVLKGFRAPGDAKPSNFKQRQIEEVTPEQFEKYYSTNPFDSLDRYITSIVTAIERKNFFGDKVIWNLVTTGQNKYGDEEAKPVSKRIDLDQSIGAYLLPEFEAGRISALEQDELVKDLKAYFGFQATPKNWARFRSLGYLTTMGSGITSTITQFQDIAFAAFEAGIGRAGSSWLASVFGISEIKIQRDLGLGNLNTEYKDMVSMAKAVDTVFTAIGLKHFGRAGQNTLVNSGIRAYRAQARKGRFLPRNQERLNEYFANDQARINKLKNDLAEGRKSNDVLLLGWNILLDYHPVDLSEMPKGYLENPRGRVAYMLKTFTIKQIDSYRREGIVEMAKGYETKDWGRFTKGFLNLTRLLAFLWLAGIPTDWLKDFVMGRDPTLSDIAVDNVWKLGGLSRYSLYYAREHGIRDTALITLSPPMPWFDYPFRDAQTILNDKKEFNLEDAETWRVVPLFGAPYYWWFGGGNEKIKNQKQKKKDNK